MKTFTFDNGTEFHDYKLFEQASSVFRESTLSATSVDA